MSSTVTATHTNTKPVEQATFLSTLHGSLAQKEVTLYEQWRGCMEGDQVVEIIASIAGILFAGLVAGIAITPLLGLSAVSSFWAGKTLVEIVKIVGTPLVFITVASMVNSLMNCIIRSMGYHTLFD